MANSVCSVKQGILKLLFTLIFYFIFPFNQVGGNVIELDNRFLEGRTDGKWLVEFYAPWCGHCQKLKPVWANVGIQMMKSHPSLHVARLDGTRYSKVMDAFEVRGFPTIKYIEGDKVFTHHGGRTSQDIIDFAVKAQGPAVKQLTSKSSLEQFRRNKDVFFVFVGEDMTSDLAKLYSTVAEKRILDSFYYTVKPDVLPESVNVRNFPALLVFKDMLYYQYEATAEEITQSHLSDWIGEEMFPAFLRISNDNINPIGRTERLIAVGVVYPSASTYKSHPHSQMLDKIRNVAVAQRDKFHKKVQFGYIEDKDMISDILLRSVEIPSIYVVDPVTFLYYELDDPLAMTEESFVQFIESVIDGTAKAQGGNSFFRKIYRVFYEIIKSIILMWLAQPILMTVLIVLPTVLVSFICYSICTAEDISEDPELEDSEDEDDDEKDQEGEEGGTEDGAQQEKQVADIGHEKTE